MPPAPMVRRTEGLPVGWRITACMHSHRGLDLFFSILGAVEARSDAGVLRPRGAMQQTLLSALLVSTNAVVPVEELILELWGTTPPAKVENALQAQVSRLRRNLASIEPERSKSRVQTSICGYCLSLDRLELDALSFVDTVEMIRLRVRRGDPRSRDLRADIQDMRGALAQWHGPVFGGLTGGRLCQDAGIGFLEARNAALSLLYELELDAGGHARILPELTLTHLRHPSHEQFCILLMRALYLAERQIDALNVYRRFRDHLMETLGIDPSPTLRDLERAILTHDPLLRSGSPSGGNLRSPSRSESDSAPWAAGRAGLDAPESAVAASGHGGSVLGGLIT